MRRATLDMRYKTQYRKRGQTLPVQGGVRSARLARLREGVVFGYALYLLLLFTSFSSFAQSGSFTATVDKKKLSANSTLQITFTLTNADGKNFTPPSFSDFSVLSGPNQSTNMQYINGSMSRSVSFSYYLKPNKEGSLTIAPASIVVQGKMISSNSVTVEVTKAEAKGEKSQQGGSGDIYTQISDNCFIRLTLDKREVYEGEPVIATYKLYHRVTMSDSRITQEPGYNGFWAQNMEIPEGSQFGKEILEGVEFNTSLVRKDALFPQYAGEFEIEPMELQTYVRVYSGRGFFSSYQDYPYKFKSNALKVKVKPLPVANVPASFKGAVGVYAMEVALNKTVTKPDEPVTLTVNITGTGNIKMLELPTVSLPADLETFDPKSSEKISKKSNVVSGSKSLEYLIIPRRGGQFKIPPVEFSYFDLSKKQYVTQRSPEFIVNVEGESTASSTPTITGINKEEVELLGEDIRYIKSGDVSWKKGNEYFLNSGIFAGLYAAPFLLFALLFAYKRREEKLSGNTVLLKNRRANKEATKRLKQAKQYLGEKNRKSFYDEITRAIWGYLGDKLNISQAALSREQVQKALEEKKIAPETIQRVFKTLDAAEMALFSPVAEGEMSKAYDDAGEIISKLDAEL